MSMTHISTITVPAGGQASIDFNSIPQTYTDLKLVMSLRDAQTVAVYNNVWIRFNGSTTGYYEKLLLWNGSSVGTYTNTNAGSFGFLYGNGSAGTATTWGSGEVYIPNYRSSSNKTISADTLSEQNGTSTAIGINAGMWSNSAAITSISVFPGTATTWVAGSTASLYGVNRIPTASLGATPTVDYLVVAGGGGGGNTTAAGGGAGGFLSSTGLAVATGSALTVTVGAGGAGGPNRTTNGSNGSNSVFSSITATGGGGGKSWDSTTAAGSGGSGGGTSNGNGLSPGTGIAGQGFAGGAAAASGFGAGGGGGAGAVGGSGNADGTVAGNGGAGKSNSYLGSTTYYAGGGGAGNYGNTAGTGGIGGGGNGKNTGITGDSGAANTGGGGGGGGYSPDGAGGIGGSGIVIIRYPDTYNAPTAVTGSPMVTYVNGYRVYTWLASGSITF